MLSGDEANRMVKKSWHISKVLLVFALVGASFVLISCDDHNSQVDESTKPPAINAVTGVVQKSDVLIDKEWVGVLDGSSNIQIRAQASGYLLSKNYKEGWLVKKGDILYEIDPRAIDAELSSAKAKLKLEEAQLATSKLELERIEKLLPERAVSLKDRDSAVSKVAQGEAQVQSAKSSIKSSELSLSYTTIRSPIDGLAGMSTVQLGELVGPNSSSRDPLTTISQIDPIRAYIAVSEKEYLTISKSVQEGDPPKNIRLTLADGTSYPLEGRILFSDRAVDASTGTVKLVLAFPNPNPILRPGQFARVTMTIKTVKDAVVVPQRAIIDIQGMTMIGIVNNKNIVDVRNITVSNRVGSIAIISSGLEGGEEIILDGQQKIRPGIQVNRVNNPVQTK